MFGASASQSSSDASWLSLKCGRPPGATAAYRRMIGARAATSTSWSITGSLRPRRRTAAPWAALTFFTQFACSPSMDTRYSWPSQSAITTGNEMVRPLRRPGTSSLAARRGNRPTAKKMPDKRFCGRASQLGRPDRYIHRLYWSNNAPNLLTPPVCPSPSSADRFVGHTQHRSPTASSRAASPACSAPSRP